MMEGRRLEFLMVS